MSNECITKNFEGYYVGLASRNSMNGLYKLQGDILLGCREVQNSTCEAYALKSHDCSKEALCHKRLELFQHQRHRHMIQFGAVKGLSKMSISNFSRPSCLSGKQSRKSITKVKSIESTQSLQLV